MDNIEVKRNLLKDIINDLHNLRRLEKTAARSGDLAVTIGRLTTHLLLYDNEQRD